MNTFTTNRAQARADATFARLRDEAAANIPAKLNEAWALAVAQEGES